jgi:nucleoside-diphosphate-sugar epimerase
MIDGNPSDIGRLSRAMEGCRLVVHTAGKLSDWGSRREFLDRNVTGTANVVDACREAGVERLVHVSSLTVLGLPRHGRVVDEETPVDPGATDPYTASRIAAERIAMEAHGRGLAVTMVRSGVIWGAGDRSIVPRLAGLLRRGRMMLIDGGRNLIALSHVENLAGGILGAAGESAAAGRLYHLTDGEEITARAAVEGIARAVGVSPPSMSLPFGLVYAAAALVEGLARLSGRAEPPAMTRYGVRLLACHCRYDISRARREIAYRPAVTFQDGMSRLSAWLHLAPAPPEVARA